MENFKILVISNGAFSRFDNNGRNLSGYFNDIKPENIAQFFVYGQPDFEICKNYYQVSDRNALHSFIKRKAFGGIKIKTENTIKRVTSNKKVEKTPLKMIIRELVWKYSPWETELLHSWITEFKPTVILLNVADNNFIIDFARRLSEKYHSPIILYSTEDYYFKEYNYMTKNHKTARKSFLYNILHKSLIKSYNKCQPYIIKGVLNSPMLARLYSNQFSFPCEYIFPKADISFSENFKLEKDLDNIKISYLGNLGLDRHKALIEIANNLKCVNSNLKLHIYGSSTDKIEKELRANEMIVFHGFVSYDRVVEIMHNSTLLIHAEQNNDYNNRKVRVGFSTKLVDSICCGTPLFIYASEKIAGTQFAIENKCAFVAINKEELKIQLKIALTDEIARKKVVDNAKISRDNHFTNQEGFFSDI